MPMITMIICLTWGGRVSRDSIQYIKYITKPAISRVITKLTIVCFTSPRRLCGETGRKVDGRFLLGLIAWFVGSLDEQAPKKSDHPIKHIIHAAKREANTKQRADDRNECGGIDAKLKAAAEGKPDSRLYEEEKEEDEGTDDEEGGGGDGD